MIFVSVGTFIKGFDELILAMDEVCAQTGLEAFAQIGNSSVLPRYMEYERFLTADEIERRLQHARLIVCHGGLGIIGDAMRAQKPIVAVPRQNAVNSADMPSNNQMALVCRLKLQYGIEVCTDYHQLSQIVLGLLQQTNGHKCYNIGTNVPNLIVGFLEKFPLYPSGGRRAALS